MLCRYVTDILKMCMKKFDAEKVFFDKLSVFNLIEGCLAIPNT